MLIYTIINNLRKLYMARHSTKRPRELALEVLKLNKAVTPSEIDKHVGGEYSSKYICQLRKRGFEFEVTKDGRNVVSYTLTKEPKNAAEIRGGTKKQKTVKAKKAAPVKTVAKAPVKAPVKAAAKATKTPAKAATPVQKSNLEKIKAVAEKRKTVVPTLTKEETERLDNLKANLKKAPPVSSVAVDEDFDAIEDVRALL
jgi:hypothetical protein